MLLDEYMLLVIETKFYNETEEKLQEMLDRHLKMGEWSLFKIDVYWGKNWRVYKTWYSRLVTYPSNSSSLRPSRHSLSGTIKTKFREGLKDTYF